MTAPDRSRHTMPMLHSLPTAVTLAALLRPLLPPTGRLERLLDRIEGAEPPRPCPPNAAGWSTRRRCTTRAG